MRFSIISETARRGWIATRSISVAESVAVIFAERRMQSRFQLFEAISLPFFKHAAARHPDFRLCIMASPLMPQPWRERLDSLIEGVPQIARLYVEPSEDPLKVFNQYVRGQMAPAQEAVCTFRIDDDDVVFDGFIDNLREKCVAANVGKVVSHENGLFLGFERKEGLVFRDITYLTNAFGIAHVSGPEGLRTIYELGNHNKLAERFEMEVIKTPRAWVRSVHRAADTARKGGLEGWRPFSELQEDFHRLYPYIDIDQMTAALKAVG